MVKPVHPISSNRPADSPTARLTSRSDALSGDVKMPGRNAGETTDSARSVAVIRTGAVKSATAYQRAPTRHVSRSETTPPADDVEPALDQNEVRGFPRDIYSLVDREARVGGVTGHAF
jgi:hypothetical protein